MAVVTAVIRTATLELDCDDIGRPMVMAASRHTVDCAVHVRPAFDNGVPFGKAVHVHLPWSSPTKLPKSICPIAREVDFSNKMPAIHSPSHCNG
jgi:hypothetical protein